MGWSNVGAVAIQATSVTLFDNAGNVVGTLDGVGGLILYGNGSADDPGLTINAFGDLIWGGDGTLTAAPSIEIGDLIAQFPTVTFRSAATISSGARNGQAQGYAVPFAASDDGTQPGGVVVSPFAFANDPGVAASPPTTPAGWHNLGLLNGWTAVAGRHAPGYHMMCDGTVLLRGSLTGGTTTAGTTIGVLPAGFRPDLQLFLDTNSNATGTVTALTILANGDINISSALGATSFALDDCRFPVAEFS